MKDLFLRLKNAGFSVQLCALVAVVLCVFGVVGPIAGWLNSGLGVAAAAIAAGLCLAGAGIALAAASALRSPDRVLVGALIGMIARMIIPLGFGMGIHFFYPPLADAGLLVYVLVFYPLTLAVEVSLTLPNAKSAKMYSGCDSATRTTVT
jgi:hypothetical protein